MDSDAWVDHLFESALGALDTLTIYIGDQLGLYDALRDHGPLTPTASPSTLACIPATHVSGSSSRRSPVSSTPTRPPGNAGSRSRRPTPRCSPTPRAWPPSHRSCG